ncbi:MAG: hypothetical protein IJW67_12105, partial [Blautia sp.]|nr:hypothetical protein [Blautia sp.]
MPEHETKQSENRKLRIFGLYFCLLFLGCASRNMVWGAAEEPENLHALSAVLMDGDSGRVLFEK